MIWRVLAVASNTRKEALRNRAFLVLVLLGLVLNATGWAMSKLAIASQRLRVIQNFGYFAVSMIAVMTAILMGVILLYKELDKKTIFTLISKPVLRYEIVLGKFLGLVSLLAGMILFLGAAWIGTMWALDALVVAGRSMVWSAIGSLWLILLEAALITSLALLFSSWTRPFLSGAFTFGYFLMGRSVFLIQEQLGAKTGILVEEGPLRDMALVTTWVVPDLQTFNASRELALGIDIHAGYLWATTGYALSFIAVFLVIGIVLFARRDFV